jgi:glycogen debranching enzyme
MAERDLGEGGRASMSEAQRKAESLIERAPAAATGAPAESDPAAERFDIAASELSSRQRSALKADDTFALIDAHGDINADGAGSDGLFHADTRFLSHLRMTVMGADPLLLGSSLSQDGTYLHADLTNPDVFRDGRIALAKDQVHIERTLYVHAGVLRQRVMLSNYGSTPLQLTAAFAFDSDFADIFEVRGLTRVRRGTLSHAVRGPDEVHLTYVGLDRETRSTRVSFSPPPQKLTANAAAYVLQLDPKSRATIVIDARSGDATVASTTAPTFLTGLVSARRSFCNRLERQAGVSTGSGELNEVLRRSAGDVAMLMTETPSGPYPYAGIPWFSTVFGRDGIITAMEMLWLNPSIARGVLKFLAAHQASIRDADSDAEPGKILHELRRGEMAALREVPFGRYYGSVDSTPLFVVLAGLYWERTGDDALLEELWPAIEAALAWMDTDADRDGDGFIEYYRATPSGLANQGWKDSYDSIFHADGTLAAGPIALVEVQAYAYEARMLAARAARHLGLDRRAAELTAAAERLRERFEGAFWSDELGSYALALDGDKRPCLVRSSNAGQVLRSGIAAPERAALVAQQLLSPAFFSGWGVRTIADGAVRYNPMSYHDGSIWPHDNALIGSGLRACGRRGDVARLLKALLDAASVMDQRRLPELFCGFPRRRGRAPVLYPVACSPQAWASGALFHLLQSLLGLKIDGHARKLRIERPHIPDWLGHVELTRLAVADAYVSIRLSRASSGATEMAVLANDGGAEVELV